MQYAHYPSPIDYIEVYHNLTAKLNRNKGGKEMDIYDRKESK